ncbi:ABC transporter ATP-binding protein [[Limnothrix rosea] IAM M-220]|uniref:ABC transporter ATP-binding protein n=1 Tax=[Limnothrix rosea] IAM M-220 TaxID=454133 RepID=UPI00095D5F0C|nr:nitrate ABC transporter ATP-binding protein [[Limnothrix rosea] IAM M-220]OKH13151.1 bacitracin ABC transporter ATP-binding protein [[Limnothrix rosea] IAM M-220]
MMTAPETSLDQKTTTAFLELKDITKVYPTKKGPLTVLDGVNLTVNEGEFICIIGHSGCGKSTMLNMVSGFNQPTSGTVTLHGNPITTPGPDRMMVFQNYCLLPWKNAHDNVALAVNTVCKDQPKSEREATIQKYMEMVGLTEAGNKKPHQISGGMKQRVAIARALSIHPEVLILDEPFGALDAITKEELQDELLEIWRANKITVLMITHDIDEALFLADRIVMMTNGPSAKIGEIMEVPFERPRNRNEMTDSPKYVELRNYALDYLFHRYAHDEDDDFEDEPTPNPMLKVAGIVGGVAIAALIGWGIFQAIAPKKDAPAPTSMNSQLCTSGSCWSPELS